jgi:hypothetical protein
MALALTEKVIDLSEGDACRDIDIHEKARIWR